MARSRSADLGPAVRPIAVPDDVDSPSLTKAEGRVELAVHIRWSGQPKTYYLAVRADRLRVYEQVLREGTDDDVRHYIDVDELVEMWDDLVLPPSVRWAWAEWFRGHRQLELAC